MLSVLQYTLRIYLRWQVPLTLDPCHRPHGLLCLTLGDLHDLIHPVLLEDGGQVLLGPPPDACTPSGNLSSGYSKISLAGVRALEKSASEEFDGGGKQVCHYPMFPRISGFVENRPSKISPPPDENSPGGCSNQPAVSADVV